MEGLVIVGSMDSNVELTKTRFIGDDVAWYQGYVTGETMRTFMDVEETPEPMPGAMLFKSRIITHPTA